MADLGKPVFKPRRTKGTIAYKTRSYFALGVIGVGILLGILYNLSGPAKQLKESIRKGKYDDTEEQIDRKLLLAFATPIGKRSASLKEFLDSTKDPESH